MLRTLVLALAIPVSCSPPVTTADVVRPSVDIFISAASNTPGGVWTAAWLPPRAMVDLESPVAGGWDRFGYVTAGFVDVDPAVIPATQSRGRLVGFDGNRTFATLCTADFPLRAVVGTGGHVLASGDGGGIVNYDPLTHGCERTVSIATDVIIHAGIEGGGVVYWAGRRGNRGAIFLQTSTGLEEDGSTSAGTVPPILALSYDPIVGFWAVGESGTVLRRAVDGSAWQAETLSGNTDTLRAVSSETSSVKKWTMAAGGTSGPSIFAWNSFEPTWRGRSSDGLITVPLNGIHVRNDHEVYFVGTEGLTAVYNGVMYYVAPQPRVTNEDLLFVSGRDGVYIAGGGTVADRTAAQHGVLLIRGVNRPDFEVDGEVFQSVGRTRQDFGGGGSVQ